MNTIFTTPTVLAHNGVDHSKEHAATQVMAHYSIIPHWFHLAVYIVGICIVLGVIIWGKEDPKNI